MSGRPLDVICIGRSSVDLYGAQVGGRLEDVTSFAKYVGGCPTNISVGTARLGLKSALVTRVGDEHMGRFIREQLAREGVDTSHVITDPERMTALVILGIRDRDTFPLIFYRANCADMAISPDDMEPAFIASAKAIVVTGTHFSSPTVDRASRHAMRLAREAGTEIVFDIDYRPVLWGLTGHGLGEERFVADDDVTAHLQTILPDCGLVVGTEEELHIAGGTTDTLDAVRKVRALTDAVIVCKLGPMGCVVFPDAIPDNIDNGIKGPGFPVEVFNVLGAGDAFMSGFLRGWLRNLPIEECCRFANACGAFAVSRHGCAPAIPSWIELEFFLENGSLERALRKDARLTQIHWATNRRKEWAEVCAFAFDHRRHFEDLAERHGVSRDRIPAFKKLAFRATQAAVADGTSAGIIADSQYAREVLEQAADTRLWIGRPIEQPGSRPLRFEGGPDVGSTLDEWPVDHTVKCLLLYHPDDPETLRVEQEERVVQLFSACRAAGLDLLLEVIASKHGPIDDGTVAAVIERFYSIGVYPDWWKLEDPRGRAAWARITDAIDRHDPHCRGVLLLGLDAPEDDIRKALSAAAIEPICKGFTIGRTIFGATADDWFAGRVSDRDAVRRMAEVYSRLIATWREARARITNKKEAR